MNSFTELIIQQFELEIIKGKKILQLFTVININQ